jgi:hypothetical protein
MSAIVPGECCGDHEHGEPGKVIRTPRAYDWPEVEQFLNRLGFHRVDSHMMLDGAVGVIVGHSG